MVSIGAASSSVVVRDDHEVEVDSTNLLLRATCTISKPSEMKEHLSHEFDRNPPSLFTSGVMRRNTKSCLAKELKTVVESECVEDFDNLIYIFDGGNLLHRVPWPENATYDQVADAYVSYVTGHAGDKFVVFDGYGDVLSTKLAEQKRRATPNTSMDIIFTHTTAVIDSKESFLRNRKK